MIKKNTIQAFYALAIFQIVGCGGADSDPEVPPVNKAPVATGVSIIDTNEGDLLAGDVLKGSFNYSDAEGDPEGDSQYRWFANGEAIDGATDESYTVLIADRGKEISFEVTPLASSGTSAGIAVVASSMVVNSLPTASNLRMLNEAGSAITETSRVGISIDAYFEYSDIDEDEQDGQIIQWLRDGSDIIGADSLRYTTTIDDIDTTLSFSVIPKSISGELIGDSFVSSVIDVVGLQVIDVSPQNGTNSVGLTPEITASFSEELLNSSIDIESFSLSNDGNLIDASVSYDELNSTATLVLATDLEHLSEYTATLTGEITAAGGSPLEEYEWTFTTRDRVWSDSQLVEDEEGEALGVDLAFSENGNGIAVWAQSDGTRYNIWANNYSKDGGWEEAQLIEVGDGTAGALTRTPNDESRTGRPDIAVDDSGNAIAVWSQQDDGVWNVYYNFYDKNNGWGAASLIEEDEVGEAIVPEVAMNANGDAVVVWRQQQGINEDLHARRYVDGVWLPIEELENTNRTVAWPQVEMTDSGDILVVWVQDENSQWSVWSRSFSENTGWQDELTLESSAEPVGFRTKISMNESGNAIVTWTQVAGIGQNDLYANTRFGNVWSGAELLEAEDTESVGIYDKFNVALNASNEGVVAWQLGDDVYINQITLGEVWSLSSLVSELPIQDSFPDVAIDPKGDIIVTWQETIEAQYEIMTRRFVASSQLWDEPITVSNGEDNATKPIISSDHKGNMGVIWLQDESVYSSWFN